MRGARNAAFPYSASDMTIDRCAFACRYVGSGKFPFGYFTDVQINMYVTSKDMKALIALPDSALDSESFYVGNSA